MPYRRILSRIISGGLTVIGCLFMAALTIIAFVTFVVTIIGVHAAPMVVAIAVAKLLGLF